MARLHATIRRKHEDAPNVGLSHPFFFYLTLFALLALLAVRAWAAGDVERGHALAQTWCATCHTVDRNGPAKDTAPSFGSIAARGQPDQLRARAFLNAPHPPMPDFNLARAQIDDIVAYLASLAPQK